MAAPFKNVTFDDRDTDRFRYAGGWFLIGSYNASRTGESGTLSSTDDTAANVTFTFPTPALGFAYYGMPRCCGGNYLMCVDCDPNKPNWIPVDAVVPNDDGQNPPVPLFTQFFEKPGIHEIILTNQPDSRFGGKSQITLDRFELFVPDGSAVPSSTIAVGATSSPRPSISPAGAASQSSPSNNVAIIAGIAGGVVVLIILLLTFFLIYRKKQQRRRAALMMETPPMEYSYAPRVDPSPDAGTLRYAPSMRSASLSNYSGGRTHTTTPSISTYPASLATSRGGPRRETDAGQVLEEDEDVPTLPPEYGQVFGRRRTADGLIVLAPPESIQGDNSSNSGLTSNSELSSRDVKTRF